MSDQYDGEVCYVGHDHDGPDGRPLESGWHYSVVDGIPCDKLVLDDDGYRLADNGDKSHHERHHQKYVQIAFEDAQESMQVTPEQLEAIKQILGQE